MHELLESGCGIWWIWEICSSCENEVCRERLILYHVLPVAVALCFGEENVEVKKCDSCFVGELRLAIMDREFQDPVELRRTARTRGVESYGFPP